MENVDIRSAFMSAGIKQWEVAAAVGVSESHFSKKLRHKLPAEDKQRIFEAIEQLAQERKEVG